MPANLTPQYKKVEDQYRAATSDEERVVLLEEMLRIIPKHKGTEHIQAELKRKLSQLKEKESKPKAGGKAVDIFHVPRSGAGQVVLLGAPNSGKSAIVGAITKAKVNIADFPFATQAPVPGIAYYEDAPIQVIDMPPVTADYAAPGQVGTYRNGDLIGIVIDLSGDVLEQMQVCLDYLISKNLLNTPGNEIALPGKEAFVIGTKSDIAPACTLDTLKELTDQPFDYIEISAQTGFNLDKLVELFFKKLKVIRVYAKPPGKPADMTEPFTVPIGSTVMDLATKIHRELANKLKSARAWGTGVYEGQSVQRTHVLNDKDIIELHFE